MKASFLLIKQQGHRLESEFASGYFSVRVERGATIRSPYWDMWEVSGGPKDICHFFHWMGLMDMEIDPHNTVVLNHNI
jgi:hypothetical protein